MAGAISGGTYLALAAMVASAAIQYQATQEAQANQKQAITNSLNSQEELQKTAEAKVMDTAKRFDPNERLKNQAQLSEDITAGLIAPVSESQKIRSENAGVQGNVSNDYNSAKATSDLNTLKTAESMARLLGKTTSSNRLRMNEGVDLMNTGQRIDQLNNFSNGQKAADSIAIQQAGLIDPGKVFAGQLLAAAGSAGMMYGGQGVTEAGTAAKYGTDVGSAQTAQLFAQDASMAGGGGGSWLAALGALGRK